MGKKGGAKKGSTSKQKPHQSQPAGPASNVKSGVVGISQKHASKIRELVADAAETPAEAHQSTTAEELKQIYSSLVGHGFQHADIQAALKAVQPVLANTALDWLCMHVPPDRLPARFAAGAHSHRAEAITKVQAASSRPAPVKSAAEVENERRAQQRELKAQAERSAAAAARRRAEEAQHAEANKAAILAKYAGSSEGWEESASDGGESEVEDWELWGDPREVERRRAERARAAQLNMLTPEERQLQLAKELKQATDSAKQAKASGNKKQKQVAGEVIRHIKLEIAALGIKEGAIHQLIAQHFPSADPPVSAASKGGGGKAAEATAAAGPPPMVEPGTEGGGVEGTWNGDRGRMSFGSEYVLAEARPSMEQQLTLSARPSLEQRPSDAWDHEYVLVGSDGSDHAVLAASLGEAAVKAQQAAAAPREAGGVTQAGADVGAAGGGGAVGGGAGSAGGAPTAAEEEEEEFNANMLWDDDEVAGVGAAEEATAADGGGAAGDPGMRPQVPTRVFKPKPRPTKAQPELPVGLPKAVLQQLCHKSKPAWPAPRFNKLSRTGEPPRYACTIVFPKARTKASKKNGQQPPSGTRTWQLQESEDVWDSIQDAQNAAALKALFELMPALTDEYQLKPPFSGLWEKWQDAGAPVGAAAEAEEYDAFIDSLLQRPNSAQKPEAPADEPTAPAPEDLPGRQQVSRAPSPMRIEREQRLEVQTILNGAKASSIVVERLMQEEEESARMKAEQQAFSASAMGREWADKRQQLPVCQVREQLLDILSRGHCAVLSGDTGCGKTTQVPQYLLEHEVASSRGASCHIICTQPRRIAAISVAERVAQERAEPPPGKRGSRVGYHVRMDPAISRDTRVTFCTTGILLRRLAGDANLSGISHIVVDEVHERSLQGDFLLAILRRLVAARAHTPLPLKVVLMSATIDLELLSGYLGGCPTLSAKGRTFPVTQFFLEDVYEMTGYHLPEDSPAAMRLRRDQGLRKKVQKQGGKQAHLLREGWGDDEKIQTEALNKHYDGALYAGFRRSVHTNLARLDESAIDYDLLDELVRHIDTTEDPGAILVFLPGLPEIMNLVDRLNGSHHFQQGKHVIIPLHSTIAPEDQRRAFVRPPAGTRKIVVSTNIAETSVTIEDVVYVIDSGKLKERRFNAARGISMLVLDHVSQASSRQRKGRAGRVREGKCYSLFTRDAHDTRMAPFQVPEIMRVPLEELVLQIHLLGLGRAAEFLPEALQPPPDKAVAAAVDALRTLGALDDDERLTPLGTYLAQLPVDPRLGKLLVTSVFMGCLSAAVTIAACLSYKSPFSTAFAVQEAADLSRRHFASPQGASIAAEQQSDHLVMLAAFGGWQQAFERGGARLAREFIKKHNLSYQALQTLRDMRQQFAMMLAEIKLISKPDGATRGGPGSWLDVPSAEWNAHSAKGPVVKAALCAAMYPQVACMDSDAATSKRPTWLACDVTVSIHRSSVLHPLLSSQFGSPYVVYSEKMQTSSIFMRETSVVPPMALLLFGGELDVHHDSGYILLDSWLKVKAAAQTAVLVKKLRSAWVKMMDDRVKSPATAFSDKQNEILATIVELIMDSGS